MSLTIIVGPSCGVGKTAICRAMVDTKHDVAILRTNTSRKKRKEEKGLSKAKRNYHFWSKRKFEKMIRKNEFFEHVQIGNNYYGTRKKDIENAIKNRKKHWITVLDIRGALFVKENYPDVLTVFILPPSMEVLKERLIKRGSETAEEIEERLNWAIQNELPKQDLLDAKIVNDELAKAVDEIYQLIINHNNK